ncbi:MAG: hypothetical protein WBC44_12985 [Planctomycetaceae bacterium]
MTKPLLLIAIVSLPAFALAQDAPKADKPVATGVTIGPEGPVVAPPPGQPESQPGQPVPSRRDEPQLHTLTITPAAEPLPPLEYRFDVPFLQRKPGNSATFYYRAIVQLGEETPEAQKEFEDLYTATHDLPPDQFPVEKAREILSRYQDIFDELERATVRERTDWNWHLDELNGPEAISFRLTEIQEARHLARLLYLKARLEIAEARFDDAEKTLRTGYALARAVAEPPTIINALVGIAIGSIMDAAVLDWIGKEGSPNAYWALSSLPDPLVDMRPALEYDLAFPFRFAPWLANAATDGAPPAVWRDRFAALGEELNVVGDLIGGSLEPSQAVLAGLALRSYSSAKQALVEEQGYSAEEVETMPVGQVLAIRQSFIDRMIADELLKAELVSSEAAADIVARAEESLKERSLLQRPGLGREPLPLMALLAPATRQAAQAEWRLSTKLAGLRVIEAIRMHAAATGALPKSLADIKVVPVPDNPTTGEPFAYRLEGEKAVLDVAVQGGHPSGDWRVELTLEK